MVQVQAQSLPKDADTITPVKVREAIEFEINGKPFRHTGDPAIPLLWYLRDVLRLTGTKYAGDDSGADLVLINDRAQAAGRVTMAKLQGKRITTVEGLAHPDGSLHPLQQAFIEADAFGCGYCTSGWLIAGVDLLRRNSSPDDNAIDQLPNVCQCGCQTRVRRAILSTAGAMKNQGAKA